MSEAETARARFRPEAIRVLFIGESVPAGGTFFYRMDSALYDATQAAFRSTVMDLMTERNFLLSFQALGCYLVDLCDRPVNKLPDPERLAERDAGVSRLADFIGEERPATVINVMRAIAPWIDRALEEARFTPALRFDLPFPRRTNPAPYIAELSAALVAIRRAGLFRAGPG
jgi:hypothetical protein